LFIDMATPFEHRHPSEHSAEDLWKALNTPFTGDVADAVYPWFDVSYALLDESRIGEGTRIRYAPNAALISKLGSFADAFPELPFTVEELSDDDMRRVEALKVDKAEGRLTRRVEEAEGGSGLLVVEGVLAVKGFMGSVAEGPAIKYAIERPGQQLVEHIPDIIRQADA
jgi:hypothetical protein